MSEPSVCFLLPGTGLYGGVKIVFEQAEQLAARGIETTIATLEGPPAWYDLDVPLVTVPDFGGRRLPRTDLYVGTSWTSVPGAHDSGLGIGAHLVQGYEGDFEDWAQQTRAIEFVYGLRTAKIAIAPHLVKLINERFGQPCRLVRNGLDLNTFHAQGRTPGERVRVLVAGPYEAPYKGVALALAAVARARAAGADIELVRLTQNPPLAAEHSQLVADEHHVGLRPADVGALLRTCDIVLAANSEHEGFGLPALEGMACGCAAVLSDTPAHRGFGEALGGWEPYARIVPRDAQAMAAALVELAGDASERAKLAASGTALAERYGWDVVGDELADAYRTLVVEETPRWSLRSERMVPGETDALTEAIHLQHYALAATIAPGRRVIDAGCGVGYGSETMAKAGATSVLALDYAQDALDFGATKHAHPAITWQQADLRTYAWEPDSADLVTCFEVYEHLEAPQVLVAGYAKALTDDGVLLVSTPNGEHFGTVGDPDYVHHIREYDEDEMRALLGVHFGEVELLGQSIQNGSLALLPFQRERDMFFVARCSRPRVHAPAERFTIVAAPTWYTDDGWQELLAAWCEAFDPTSPVTLELLAPDLARAEAEVLAALTERGIDPQSMPDVALTGVGSLLPSLAERLVTAHGLVLMGRERERVRRIGLASGVPVHDAVDAETLRALASEALGASV